MYKIGFYTGLCWSASFLLAMLSLKQPALGFTGNLLGLASFLVAGWQLRAMQMNDVDAQPWGVHRRWRMSLQAQMLAAVLCLFVQYMYFRYVDNGLFMTALADMYDNPQTAELMQQMMPGKNSKQMLLEQLSQLTLNQLAVNFMLVNAMFAIILSIPTAIVARVKTTRR